MLSNSGANAAANASSFVFIANNGMYL